MVSFTARSSISLLVPTSVCLILAVSSARAQDASSSVRVLDADLASTLRDAYRTSSTLRALVHELEQSDVIVHVVGMGVRLSPLDGRLAFVHAGGGRRMLRIAVNRGLAPRQRAAVLAHELQHAVEVARAASVMDASSFAALYQRIGYRVSSGAMTCYETDEARDVARRVVIELTQTAAASRAARRSSARRAVHTRQVPVR